MISFVTPPFIHLGMLIWVEMSHPKQDYIEIPCEILTIKESTVEVCVLSDRSCFWIDHKDIHIKIVGVPAVYRLNDSLLHAIMP